MQTASHTAQARVAQVRAQAAIENERARQEREALERMDRAMKFAVDHADVMVWIESNPGNEFAQKLAGDINKYGHLTPNQVAAVRRSLAPRAAAAAITVEAIEQAFERARERGVKKPAMRLDLFKFKAAGESSANPGAIYVTEGEQYLGKVLGGKFLRVRECDDDKQARIIAAAANPDAAAEAYGRRTGQCSICGRELTAEESIERFIGPICASKYGF